LAVFDPKSGKLVVRIVYDGLAEAGKTTNVAQLCRFFGTRRRSELFTPATDGGRTAYFDWLRLDAGLVMGRQLSCHLITVPGQRRWAHRRRRLLSIADVVVFVCDSRRDEAVRARRRFKHLVERHGRSEGNLRLLLQANKQDLEGALAPPELATLLNAPRSVPSVSARAATGVGVRETAVLAIRTAADHAQQRILSVGVDSLSATVLSGEGLFAAMRADEREAPMMGSVLELDTTDEEDEQLAELEVEVAPRQDAAISARKRTNQTMTDELTWNPPSSTPPEPKTIPVPPRSEATTGPPPSKAKLTAPAATPALPKRDVPSGYIWPGIRGREVIASLELSKLRERSDLVDQPGHLDGSGRADAHVYELVPWCMKTSERRRYDDHEGAREALAHLARAKVSLGAMLMEDTVLALARGDDGTWLWTIAPWVDTLRARLTQAHDRGDAAALREALKRYADAAVNALHLTLRRGVVLDIHPSNFAVQGGETRYIDDDIAVGSLVPTFGHAVLQRLVEYQDAPEALEAYVTHLLDSLLDIEEHAREQLQLLESFERAQSASATALEARDRIVHSLRRGAR
jgi:signal recognition particle receptor subunit beta